MTDKRKKENPKNHLLGFKTDFKTMTRIKDEAKRKGVSVSQHLNDKLKPWKRFKSSSPIVNTSNSWRRQTNSTPPQATWHGWRLQSVLHWNRTAGEDNEQCRDATRERLQHHEDRRLPSSLFQSPWVALHCRPWGFFYVKITWNNMTRGRGYSNPSLLGYASP